MAYLRQLQGFAVYRTITNATTEDVLESDWLADLDTELSTTGTGTAHLIYSLDEVVVSCFFLNSGDTIVLEPHFYDRNDVLLGLGSKITFTPSASSSVSVDIGAGAATHFSAPTNYFVNPGAFYLRIKATTLPTTANVGIFIGARA